MKRVTASYQTERAGIHAVAKKVHEELGWIFRDQDGDFGIDAHIEVVTNHRPSGKIIAAQIKSGESYFSEEVSQGIVFRGEREHLDYWLNHDLPVIVILYNPANNIACWQSVDSEHVSPTEKGWKLVVPLSQKLERTQAEFLEKLASKQEQLRNALAEYKCPFCGAELVERGGEHIGPNLDHYALHEIFACGYHACDGYIQQPCPSDPKFPKLEEYEFKSRKSQDGDYWYCIANPKTDMARKLHLRVGVGQQKKKRRE